MNPNDKLTLQQLVELIASRDRRNGEEHRETRDRTRKRIDYAIEKGELKPDQNGSFTVANLSFFLCRKWPGKFDDFPVVGIMRNSLPMPVVKIFGGPSWPDSIEECHALLWAAHQRITTLEEENSNLKSVAIKYAAYCEQNRKNAKKKGRGTI